MCVCVCVRARACLFQSNLVENECGELCCHGAVLHNSVKTAEADKSHINTGRVKTFTEGYSL